MKELVQEQSQLWAKLIEKQQNEEKQLNNEHVEQQCAQFVQLLSDAQKQRKKDLEIRQKKLVSTILTKQGLKLNDFFAKQRNGSAKDEASEAEPRGQQTPAIGQELPQQAGKRATFARAQLEQHEKVHRRATPTRKQAQTRERALGEHHQRGEQPSNRREQKGTNLIPILSLSVTEARI